MTSGFAKFYETETIQTHGASYCAFYMGRNSVWYEMPKSGRNEFKAAEDFNSYLRGRKSAQAELRLDADTEWDADMEVGA